MPETAPAKAAFPPPAAVPSQIGPRDLRFDFNLGGRVAVPEGSWRVTLRDLDTGNILFDQETNGALVKSSKRYFERFLIDVCEAGETIFAHDV